MNSEKHDKSRDNSLDFLRGTAIILMIVVHVFSILYSGGDKFVDFWVWFGVKICFTTFLLVFAMVLGLKLRKDDVRNNENKKLPPEMVGGFSRDSKRLIKLGLGYYFFAYLSYFLLMPNGVSPSMGSFFDVAVLTVLPGYTEFILSFIWYLLLFTLVKPVWSWLAKHYYVSIPLSWIIFSYGLSLYQMEWGSGYINTIKAQLVGQADFNSFGLLSYLPVFVMGLVWGYHIVFRKNSAIAEKSDSVMPVSQISQENWGSSLTLKWAAFLVTVFSGIYWFLKLNELSGMDRWPPQARFLLYGLIYDYSVILLYPLVRKFTIFDKAVSYVGKRPFEYYSLHLLIIFPAYYFYDGVRGGVLRGWIFFGLVMLVITVVLMIGEIRKGVGFAALLKRKA